MTNKKVQRLNPPLADKSQGKRRKGVIVEEL